MSAASTQDTVTAAPSRHTRPRVVIVDDYAPFREVARLLLAARGYNVVAEASCAATALNAVERHAPDGVLLDVCLGDDNGFVVCESLTRARPGLAVLLASADVPYDPALIARCGASGFVRKDHLTRIDFGTFWPRRTAAIEAA